MRTASAPRHHHPRARSARWSVVSRLLAGAVGGYALAAFTTTTLALASRAPRDEAVHLATLPSFLIWTAAIVWAFSARTARGAWLGIVAPTALLGGVTAWLLHAATP
jgi:hypothetical protein